MTAFSLAWRCAMPGGGKCRLPGSFWRPRSRSSPSSSGAMHRCCAAPNSSGPTNGRRSFSTSFSGSTRGSAEKRDGPRLQGPATVLQRLPAERPAAGLDAIRDRRPALARVHPLHAGLQGFLPEGLWRLPAPHAGRDARAGAAGEQRRLRRVWWHCCKDENIDPRNPTRLPFSFALDSKLNIEGGYRYVADCSGVRRNGGSGAAQCGGDFASSSVDGSTDGFGNGGSDSSGDGGGSSDGGDGGGGGCGGGGGD